MQLWKNNANSKKQFIKCCECFACKCGMKASIFTFSYFMYSKISINIEMHIIYCWALEYSVKNAFAEIQIGYNRISHTHTVCVPYYKAAPYNISHTKIFQWRFSL